jgi:hypothetical protein
MRSDAGDDAAPPLVPAVGCADAPEGIQRLTDVLESVVESRH